MATKASRGVALIPLTITFGVDRTDVTIPQSIPLVELLPGLVESVGAFSDQPTNDGSPCVPRRVVSSISRSPWPRRECVLVLR